MSGSFRQSWALGVAVAERVRAAGIAALKDGTEYLLEEANRTVPLREGTLMRSGVAEVDEDKMIGYVSYDTPYALRLHEHPEYHFFNGRRGKWLQLTFQEQMPRVQQFFSDHLKGVTK